MTENLINVVQLMVENTQATEEKTLWFRNNLPGVKFCRGFEKIHFDVVLFRSAQLQQTIRYRSKIGVTSVHNSSKIESSNKWKNIDPKRIVNVETALYARSEEVSAKIKGIVLEVTECCIVKQISKLFDKLQCFIQCMEMGSAAGQC